MTRLRRVHAWSRLPRLAARPAELIVLEALPRRALNEFNEYYNTQRPHQGIGRVVIAGTKQAGGQGEVECHERLGGLLKKYGARHRLWSAGEGTSCRGRGVRVTALEGPGRSTEALAGRRIGDDSVFGHQGDLCVTHP